MIGCLLVLGCGPIKTDYTGSVRTTMTNGNVSGVAVKFPNGSSETSINNPEDVDRVIAQLESMTISLKEARKQMGGVNPAPK
jgi:hypothetical protein